MSENTDNITENNYPTAEVVVDTFIPDFDDIYEENETETESSESSLDDGDNEDYWVVINKTYFQGMYMKYKKIILIILCVIVLFFYFKGKKNTNITINVR